MTDRLVIYTKTFKKFTNCDAERRIGSRPHAIVDTEKSSGYPTIHCDVIILNELTYWEKPATHLLKSYMLNAKEI